MASVCLHNVNIERSVLASILFDPSKIEDAQEILVPEDFYMPFHKHVFEAMLLLHAKEKPIDEEFLRIELTKEGRFNEDYMLEIISTNSLPSIKSYAEDLRNKSSSRAYMDLSHKIQKMTTEDLAEVHEISEHIDKTNESILDRTISSNIRTNADHIRELEESMRRAVEGDGSFGYGTGLNSLDSLMGGMEPGELVIVSARPGMGKTAFATTIANNSEQKNIGVLFDSLEMDGEKIMRRLIANRADEKLHDIKRGYCKNLENFNKAKEDFLKTRYLVLHHLYYPDIRQLCAKAAKVFRKNPQIKLWIIDHLKHIKVKTSASYELSIERGEQLKQIVKVAKDYGVVPIVLHQLNRGSESRGNNKRPLLSDLGQSSSIEELASWVIFPHRSSYYEAQDSQVTEDEVTPAELIVAKARDGQLGVAHSFFCGMHSRFQNHCPIVYETQAEYEKKIEMGPVI